MNIESKFFADVLPNLSSKNFFVLRKPGFILKTESAGIILTIENGKNQTESLPEAVSDTGKDVQKGEKEKRKYTPRKKTLKPKPKNRLQWGD